MSKEPTTVRLLLEQLTFTTFDPFYYRKYINDLNLEGNESLLDFHPGIGATTYFAAEKLPEGRLTYIDTSKKYMAKAKKNLSAYRNITYLINEEHLKDKSFDIILIHFALQEIPPEKRLTVLKELSLKLKPEGRLYLRESQNLKEISNILNHLSLRIKKLRFLSPDTMDLVLTNR